MSSISVPFQYDPANHRNPVEYVILSNPRSALRNQTQRDLILALNKGLPDLAGDGILNASRPCTEVFTCYTPDQDAQNVRSYNEEPVFRHVIYLFNVIVAMEWNPSARSYQQIRNAWKQASNFLYDATNGYAAFGQIVIGGPDLMPVADIQIMASNRLHPRAWIDALHVPTKFKPIRVGRGLWQKNESLLAPWDSPEGYRALVHEWGHYAFGLADEYLEPTALTRQLGWRLWKEQTSIPETDTAVDVSIVAPTIALAVNTLMANTQISEFIEWPTILSTLQRSITEIDVVQSPQDQLPLDGPNGLPLPLPQFVDLSSYPRGIAIAPSQQPEEVYLPISNALDYAQGKGSPNRADQSHWLYLLKQFNNYPLPQQIIAQGKTGDRDRTAGFPLYGASNGDVVVLVSQVGDQVTVQRTTVLLTAETTQQQIVPLPWQDVTPPDHHGYFFVDVIPRRMSPSMTAVPAMQADIYVQIETAGPRPDQLQIYPAGDRSPAYATPLPWVTDQVGITSIDRTVPHLDGHVLLRWTNPAAGEWEGLFIASYSQGGGPNTSGGGRLPITAGSSDGNAMLFFRDNSPPLSKRPDAQADQGVRVVTTTLTVGQQTLPNGAEARSYVFSLASNADLTPFPATLVLYYDREALKRNGDLLIYRWDTTTKTWVPLTTYSPLLPYVAIPLMGVVATAPALMQSAETAVERYRIFWTPTDTKLTK